MVNKTVFGLFRVETLRYIDNKNPYNVTFVFVNPDNEFNIYANSYSGWHGFSFLYSKDELLKYTLPMDDHISVYSFRKAIKIYSVLTSWYYTVEIVDSIDKLGLV